MSLSAINLQQTASLLSKQPVLQSENQKEEKSFADMMKTAINEVNDTQIASDKKTMSLASGNINDLHDVMITAKKASITLGTAVQIQRKAVDAYNEIMRMQV